MSFFAALLAQQTSDAPPAALRVLLLSPLFWALVAGAVGLWLAIIGGSRWPRRVGMLLAAVGLLILGSQLPRVSGGPWHAWAEQVVFWLLAALAVVSAAAVITMRSPVYSAVWFAVTLLAVSGLLFFQGAQFLGVATMAVYAGAILVTFLFVLMLAQPEGFAFYDRLSWGNAPAAVGVAACLTFAVGAAYLIGGQQPLDGGPRQGGLAPSLRDQLLAALPREADDETRFTQANLLAAHMTRPDGSETDILLIDAIPPAGLPADEVPLWSMETALLLTPVAAQTLDLNPAAFTVQISTRENLQAREHVARLGGNLFSRYLIAIQAAGALLLAALVGAVAIAMHGNEKVLATAAATLPEDQPGARHA
jgi:NADH:ubiquinone oxidoreductase subunit 6 (subunit J)